MKNKKSDNWIILMFSVAAFLLLMLSQIAFAGDVTVTGGDAELQKNNEIFLSLKNTQAGGKDYALVSAGSAGGIGLGKFSIWGNESYRAVDYGRFSAVLLEAIKEQQEEIHQLKSENEELTKRVEVLESKK